MMATCHILVVEDENIVALDLRTTLESLGYAVSAMVATGEEAVIGAGEFRPDLVLMDIRLKGQMDGVEAASQIRKQFDIPVVYLTAYADEATLQRAKRTEPYGYVLKPFEEVELYTNIETALYKHKMDFRIRSIERWLTTTLESIADGVITTDTNDIVNFINRAAEVLTGWQAGHALGQPLHSVFQIIEESTGAAIKMPVADVTKQGMTIRAGAETVLVARDGARTPVTATISPIRAEHGKITGAVIAFQNISERRHIEVVQRARDIAEQANVAKSEFLSLMSHELRTPLSAILGFAQLLQMEAAALSTEQQESVDYIMTSGQHLLRLVNEVLDLACIETGQLNLVIEAISLDEVIHEVLGLTQPLAAVRDIEVTSTGGVGAHCYIDADRQRLVQVLLNLISNALKYGDEQSTVSITCAVGQHHIMLKVIDHGPGIAEDKLDHLFLPFNRLGAERTSVEGTGLGLALSKRLIEAMHGRIGVTSTRDFGSTFWIELPLAEAPPATLSSPATVSPALVPLPSMTATIVYIEDNLTSLALMRSVLRRRPQITLLPAMQGHVGLELVQQHHPDLILLDLNLPDIGGDEVLNALQADPVLNSIPVIMLSADVLPATIEKFLTSGTVVYLTKPVDVNALLTAIDRLLNHDPPRAVDGFQSTELPGRQ